MTFFISAAVLLIPLPAYAYVGPGLGLGAIGAILGVLLSVFLAIIGIFWYPIKRLFGKARKKKKNDAE
ncbi:MAG: hypothetical protein GY849_09760 [Deltaproteobacteria bacterium]|nr:hypothetical protein [Deltaproteobacteria bacterium]